MADCSGGLENLFQDYCPLTVNFFWDETGCLPRDFWGDKKKRTDFCLPGIPLGRQIIFGDWATLNWRGEKT